jgi:hypothetical protein
MYVQQGDKHPLSGLGVTEREMMSNGDSSIANATKAAYISVFGPQPGDVVGKDILGQYISAMDFLTASRQNLIAAATFKFWTRSRNGWASKSSQKGPGFLAFDTPRDARFAFDVACIQRLAGLKATGAVDRATLELLFAIEGEPFRDSWPGKWAHTNMIYELGRPSENDQVARIIAGGIVGKYESPVWKTRSASMTLANKVMNAAGKSNKPAYPRAVTIALTCQRNLRLALRDIWWVSKDSRVSTPESPDVYAAIVTFTDATNRSAVRQSAGQLGAADTDIMSLLKAHVSINSGLAVMEPRPIKRIFMFVNDSCSLPLPPRIVIEGTTLNCYAVKSKINAKNYLDKAVADLNTSERVDAQNRARTAAQLEENERIRREAEYKRQQAEYKRQQDEQAARRQQQRQASAQSNQSLAEKMKVKIDVLNKGVALLNDKKKLNAPAAYYFGQIEQILLTIPTQLRAEFSQDIKAALTAHLYSIMPQLKAGTPEFEKAKAEKERIAAEASAKLKALADAEAQRQAEAKAQADAAAAAAAAEAERLRLEAEASARAAQETADAQARAQAEAAARAAQEAAAAAQAEADRRAQEAAAAAEAERKAQEASAKVDEVRQEGASGQATAEEVMVKSVEAVNEITGGGGGTEIAKQVIENAVAEDPSKEGAGADLIKTVDGASSGQSKGGGGGLAVVAALGIGAFLLFGRRR